MVVVTVRSQPLKTRERSRRVIDQHDVSKLLRFGHPNVLIVGSDCLADDVIDRLRPFCRCRFTHVTCQDGSRSRQPAVER